LTTPAVTTIKRAGSRFYVHPESGAKAPGVTSVVGCLPKPAIAYWRGRSVAEEAVNNLSAVVDLVTKGNPTAAIDFLKRAPDRSSGVAAKLGSEVHAIVETINRGKDPGPLHPDFHPWVARYKDFLDKWQPEFLEVEATVWSHEHNYAGTFDGIARLDGEVVIWDLKTGKSGVWPEVALQLNAYANADVIIDAAGVERPMPEIEGAAVLALRPESYELIPVRLGPDVFEVFRHLLGVMAWESEVSKTVLGAAVDSPK
jgi:hypothetical protein